MSFWYLLGLLLSLWPEFLALGVLAAAITIIHHHWEAVRFFWTRVWYRLPVIGKAKRLSKHLAVVGEGANRWFLSERVLCDDFKSHLDRRIEDPSLYELSKSYLSKVRELGRRPMSVGGWLLICVLVFVEALGFAYVLAGYTLPGSSEALQGPAAVAIALIISIILVFITHHAGREWHKRTLVKTARLMFLNDGGEAANLVSSLARLDKDSQDDGAKPYMQLIARIEADPEYRTRTPWLNVLMAVVVLATAGFAFYVRYETLRTNQTQCVLNAPTNGVPDIFSGGLPNLVTAPDMQNRRAGQLQECNAFSRASVATYLLLAVLFIFIQIIGWLLGFRSGFSGIESKD